VARLVRTFENGTITTVLTFRGKEFTLTMPPWENGERTSKEKCLSNQVEEAFKDDPDVEDIADVVDSIDFGDEDETEKALEELNSME
jgi:hypothetical protein